MNSILTLPALFFICLAVYSISLIINALKNYELIKLLTIC